ncbi:MAG: LLM class flavin-dependent oxidoreductase [Gammaproteobacteria bacterium]
MRIDIFIPPGLSPEQTIELGMLAESNGIRALYTYNYIADYDPFINLALLARQTRTLRMGPVAVSPFQLHPLLMANSLLTLNQVSHGRADIVVGGGGAVMTAMGLKPLRKVRAVRECVEFLRRAAASTDRPIDYVGEIFTARDYHAPWLDQPPPRLYVGANGPQMCRMAVRASDGIMMSDFTIPMVEDIVRVVADAQTDRGGAASEFGINNFFAWHVKPDRDAACREARRYMVLRGILRPRYLLSFMNEEDCACVQAHMKEFWGAWSGQTHVIDGVPDRIIDSMVDNLTLTGDFSDIDRIVEHLQAFRDAGLTSIALGLHDDPAEGIRQIGEFIVPAFR